QLKSSFKAYILNLSIVNFSLQQY
ncbi:hypothetical protein JH330_002562, partial [Acinetobacter baumannii]